MLWSQVSHALLSCVRAQLALLAAKTTSWAAGLSAPLAAHPGEDEGGCTQCDSLIRSVASFMNELQVRAKGCSWAKT